MNRTANLPFYHGTSAIAAASILKHGIRNIAVDLQLHEFADEVWQLIVAHAGSSARTGSIFEKAGIPVDASVALENAANRRQDSLASYGDFYVSLVLKDACDYALRPAGSEFLALLSLGLRVLDHLEILEGENLKAKYPTATRAMDARSYPVVLKIQGVEESNVLREDGNPDCWPLIKYALGQIDGGVAHASFRVRNLRTSEIIEVFEIGEWEERLVTDRKWRPTESDFDVKRFSCAPWLKSVEEKLYP